MTKSRLYRIKSLLKIEIKRLWVVCYTSKTLREWRQYRAFVKKSWWGFLCSGSMLRHYLSWWLSQRRTLLSSRSSCIWSGDYFLYV